MPFFVKLRQFLYSFTGQKISEQKQDSSFDKKADVSEKLSIKKVDYSEIVENAVKKYSSELDEELECQENVTKMAQVALHEKNIMTAEKQWTTSMIFEQQ